MAEVVSIAKDGIEILKEAIGFAKKNWPLSESQFNLVQYVMNIIYHDVTNGDIDVLKSKIKVIRKNMGEEPWNALKNICLLKMELQTDEIPLNFKNICYNYISKNPKFLTCKYSKYKSNNLLLGFLNNSFLKEDFLFLKPHTQKSKYLNMYSYYDYEKAESLENKIKGNIIKLKNTPDKKTIEEICNLLIGDIQKINEYHPDFNIFKDNYKNCKFFSEIISILNKKNNKGILLGSIISSFYELNIKTLSGTMKEGKSNINAVVNIIQTTINDISDVKVYTFELLLKKIFNFVFKNGQKNERFKKSLFDTEKSNIYYNCLNFVKDKINTDKEKIEEWQRIYDFFIDITPVNIYLKMIEKNIK